VREIPTGPVVITGAVKRVSPVPADWVRSRELIAAAVTLLALAIKILLRGTTPPRALLNVIAPAPAVNVRLKLPLTVPNRLMAPPPLFKKTEVERVIGEPNWSVPTLETFAPRVIAPPPLCVKAPAEEIAEEIVADPVLTIAMGPLFVDVSVPFPKSVPVFKLIPLLVVVKRGADTVVSPVTVDEKGPLTLTDWPIVKFPPLEMVKPVKGVTWPTEPLKLIFPAPAAKVNKFAPLIVLLKVIAAPVPPVFRERLPVKFTGEEKLIASFVVVIEPPIETEPVPVSEKAPSREKTVPFGMISAAELVKLMEKGPPPVVVTFPFNTA